MEFHWLNIFKYIKLILVHPALDIITESIYLLTFVFIGVIIFKESSVYDEHQIITITQNNLDYNRFNSIKAAEDLKSYLIYTLDNLYTVDALTKEIPIFIPLNPVRLNFFENNNECNTKIDYATTCINEVHKFRCVISNLAEYFKYKCGAEYDYDYELWNKKLKGYYSSYDLRNNKDYIDFTRDSYYSRDENQINDILNNKKLKAIVLQINLKAPSNSNYIDVILGLEMTNYFTNIKTIFSAVVIKDVKTKSGSFIYFCLIFFVISVLLNSLKLIYEMNVRKFYVIYLIFVLVKIIDITFILILSFYIAEDKKLNFEVNYEEFESHINYIQTVWYLKIFFAIMSLEFPFRLLGVLSWIKSITESIIILFNILFKMLPGFIVSFIFITFIYFIFAMINYFLFNDIIPYYETMYQSFISSFNIAMITYLYNQKNNSKLFNNLFLSKFSIVFIYFQTLFFFFLFSIFIGTLVYTYNQAIKLEEPEEKNPYLEKLDEIEKKIEEEKNINEFNINFNADFIKRQILWLSLDKDKNKNNINQDFDLENIDILYFKSSNQIISFLKYTFTIRPEIHYMRLIYKLNIIIESNQKELEAKEQTEINQIVDWLIFKDCKIPLIFYGANHFEISYKMKLRSLYKFASFINRKKDLEKFLKIDGDKRIVICENENFSMNNNKKNNNNK